MPRPFVLRHDPQPQTAHFFFSNGNPHELVAEMVEHLDSISAVAEANLMEDPEMEALFESIGQKLEEQEEEEETEEEEDDDDDKKTPPRKNPCLPCSN